MAHSGVITCICGDLPANAMREAGPHHKTVCPLWMSIEDRAKADAAEAEVESAVRNGVEQASRGEGKSLGSFSDSSIA